MSKEICFTFIIHNFLLIICKISPYLQKEYKNVRGISLYGSDHKKVFYGSKKI